MTEIKTIRIANMGNSTQDIIIQLYELWNILPPCDTLLTIGKAIQELQFYSENYGGRDGALSDTTREICNRVAKFREIEARHLND